MTVMVMVVVAVMAVEFIVNGVAAPIRMDSFPVMKTRQARRIQDEPDAVGAQIIILSAHNTHIFITVPDITIGNLYHRRDWWRRRLNYDRRRRRWKRCANLYCYLGC